MHPRTRTRLLHVIANQWSHLWQSASPGRKVVHCSCPRVRTHLPSLSLRTSAHTGAAIRIPAEILDKLAAVVANSLRLTNSPKVLLSVAPCRREYGLPRRFAPRNDKGEVSLRTSAHTGVAIRVPAEILDKLAAVGANPQHLSYSPKVFPFVMYCRRGCGLSRRFAPRNDMLKLAACLRVQLRGAMANLLRLTNSP